MYKQKNKLKKCLKQNVQEEKGQATKVAQKLGQKGITLIALVITIIVLLILAGVSISALTGSESAMEKAKQARSESENADELDTIKLACVEAISKGTTGYIESLADLTTALGTNATDVKQNADGTFEATGSKTGRIYTINKNGQVTVEEALTENAVASLAKAGEIQRWDKINYDPGNLTTASIDLPEGASIEGTKLASINLPSGATLSGTINASSASDWVVIDVNRTSGEVKIMPRAVSDVRLTLSGKEGYNNAIQALDTVAGIYLNPTYAKSARSITIEDINKVEDYTPNGTAATYTWNHRYGMNPATLDITDTGSDSNTPSQTYTSTATTGNYYYTANCFKDIQDFWLASRCVGLSSGACYFYVRNVSGGRMAPRLLVVCNF